MKSFIRFLVAIALSWTGLAGAVVPTTCLGEFANPITDVCWSCILPITIGNAPVGNIGAQEDSMDNPPTPFCSCYPSEPYFGLVIGFWEPVRTVEVVRSPYCFPTLGGTTMGGRTSPPEAGRHTQNQADPVGRSFYQAHFFKDPVMSILESFASDRCLEEGGFDLLYITEVDPLWSDDELTLILDPEAILFSNPITIAACVADCLAASLSFGLPQLFWCDGCQGTIYPFNGNVPYHMGGVRTAELILHRFTAKLHRQHLAMAGHGAAGLCAPYLEPLMDKTGYKTSLSYPIPQTGYTDSPDGRCCQPFGRTTIFWASGKEFPARGEDFAFKLFRKRNCCESEDE